MIRFVDTSVATPQASRSSAPAAEAPSVAADTFKSEQPAGDPVKQKLQEMFRGERAIPTRQYADSYGRLTHVALMLSDYAHGDQRDQMINAYRIMFTEMEPDTKFTVVVERDEDRAEVEAMMAEANVPNPERIKFLKPNVGDLTVWARDMMVPLWIPGDPNHTALLAQTPLHDWHDNDKQVPRLITEQDHRIVLNPNTLLVTDGGDVLSNRKESFVGYYSLSSTAQKIADALNKDAALRREAIQYYQVTTGETVAVSNGSIELPFNHVPVDPTGVTPWPSKIIRNPNYVAASGGQTSEGEMVENLATRVFEREFGKPVTVMGKDDPNTEHLEEPATDHIDMGLTPIDDNTFLLGDPSLFRSGWANRDNPEDFAAYERILRDKGYNVVRVPHHEPGMDGNSSYISYNNCLMERFEKDGREIRRVFLPVYGIPEDQVAIATWESQGYEVHPMPLGAMSRQWGALRCVTNWLERTPKG